MKSIVQSKGIFTAFTAFTAFAAVIALFFIYACSPEQKGHAVASGKTAGEKTDKKDTQTSKAVAAPVFKPNHFVLMFTGDWQGHLGPCGCTEKMLGGIDRRSKIVNSIDYNQRLLLDTGRMVKADDLQSQLKLETFLLSMKQLRYDAVGLTLDELIMKDALAMVLDSAPPIIASNLTIDAAQKYQTISSFEKTLTRDNHQRNCLVLSLSEVNGSEQNSEVIDSIKAIKNTLSTKNIDPMQPSKKHLVIILLSDDSDEILASLRKIRAVDLVVKSGYADQPELVRETESHLTVLTTGHLGKYLAVIELPVDSQAHRDQISFRAIAIEEHFPKDAKIVDLIQGYLDQLEFENLVADEEKLPRLPLDEGNFFVGTDTCMGCHEKAYEVWQTVPHSHAMETLIKVNREFDPECVQCHSVGMLYEGGFRSMEQTPDLAGVGCEMCHGPGGNHIINTEKEFKVTFKRCTDCHDPENDPHFLEKSEEKFKIIKHWSGKRRPSWHP